MNASRDKKWTRRQLLASGAGLAAAAIPGALPKSGRGRVTGPGSGGAPNIVFILSDNHRWDAMGCMAHPFVRTPHLDRLAREGFHFVNAFCTTPLCSPARASFLSGRYAWQHGVHNHTTRAWWDDANVTFLELLKREAGYDTAFIGKWHMPGSPLPKLRGVDHFVTFVIQDGQGRYFDCPLVVDGREEPSKRSYLSSELTDRALGFVEAHRDRPFCVYLSLKSVHHPWRPAPDHEGLYADVPFELPKGANSWTGFTNGEIWGGFERPIENAIRSYMATVTSMDREIGRLLAGLDRLDVGDDTLVVYASDNGFLFGEHRHVELRWPFEEVIRVPLLMRHPRLVGEPGRRVEQMGLNIEVGPTFLELAGVEIPQAMQGMSLAPLLAEPATPGRHAWLVENYREFPYNAPSYQGVRTRTHLYVEYEGRFAPSLHDLVRDPGQHRDLMGTPEAERLLPELREMLAALRRGERLDA